MTDLQIQDAIIQECVALYQLKRPCPCPHSGRRCWPVNAWYIPGGAKPFCYKEDVLNEHIANYRAGDKRFITRTCTARE